MLKLKISFILLIPTFALSLLIGSMANAEQIAERQWQDKVDSQLLTRFNRQSSDENIEFIVQLEEQAQISIPASVAGSKEARGQYVYERLKQTATQSQAEIIQSLQKHGASTQPFLIVNAIHVIAPSYVLPEIAQRPDVAYLHANPTLKFDINGTRNLPFLETQAPNGVEWGIDKIGAPLLWAKGITGTDVVIAGQDTGYNWEHPALKNSYRGWDGNTADHNYNWHDSISSDLDGSNSNPCGYSLNEPCDDVNSTHGTHTMGTMTGLDGANQIGAAPGAKWIGCRNMEQGFGTPTTYINCFEWFLAPTDLADTSPNPAAAPHVINNSWGCPLVEGCNSSNFDMMDIVVENLRAAGIVVVTSAGNDGPSCSSISTPAAIFEGAFSVGATDSGDDIASFSSRGSVTVDGSGRVKPNVTAPGVLVRSARGSSDYASYSGTSMAGPHVAAAVGLMISAYPPIAGNVEALETYLEKTADFIGVGNCGGTNEFNNTYGHGRINVYNAVHAIWDLDLNKIVPDTVTAPNYGQSTLTSYFTYTLTISKTGSLITFTNTTVTDTLPAGTTFVSASQPVTLTGQTLLWSLDHMAPESVETLKVTLAISGTQGTTTTINYPAAVASADFVPQQSSNVGNSQVSFEPNLGLNFHIARDLPDSLDDVRVSTGPSGLTISYTIAMTAPLTISPTNTVLTETLPAGANLITTSETVSTTANGFVWQLGDLQAGELAQIDVVVQINDLTNIFPEIVFPSTQFSADNAPSANTKVVTLKPIKYWLPQVKK